MNIQEYLDVIRSKYASGQATEHSYRPALERLFQSIDPTIEVINEPRRVDVGAPDFVFTRNGIGIGWAEAKDIGKDITRFKPNDYSRDQKERYRKGLPNLIYTNGIDFEFLREGERINFVSIADLSPTLPAKPDRFDELSRNLQSFAQQQPISIRSAAKLAELMAGKAAIIKDVLGNLLKEDKEFRTALGGQYRAFKADLLPHMQTEEFADLYAETITYGMFAARLHDTTLNTFSRAEALTLLPKSNPFLRSLFGYIAGPDLDDRIAWIIDDLAGILRASDPSLLFKDFGKFTARNDPFIHFYEDFLKEYNPKKRKSRGVWYTPEPVVDFIVRAVDDALKTEFGLADGLADTSKVVVDWDTGTNDKRGKPVKIKKEMHRVQILDPATGTGTFLAKAVHVIADRIKARAPGKWSGYVEKDLIPRLHGFELLMASYAMCHMKLDMQLRETGYHPSATPPRLSVWLTNALEPGEREVRDLFFHALAEEARGASEVKRNKPIMCVIGNPPYSGHSTNKSDWIEDLMGAYKVSPELKRPAQAKWLSDDYVKFIRMSEHLISQNEGGGILGFITNHGYLDNPTFLDMRQHLMETFDSIQVIDLHGNAKKKERCPDGSPDKNVFDIQQGVAIIIAVRRPNGSKKTPIEHHDVWGMRASKNDWLWSNSRKTIGGTPLTPTTPPYRWKPRDEKLETSYLAGFSLVDLFSPNGRPAPGIVTTHDQFAISWTAKEAGDKVRQLLATASEADARRLFRLCSTNQWNYAAAKAELPHSNWEEQVRPIAYRPFDNRFTVYDSNVAVHRRSRVMDHFVRGPNIGLGTARSNKNPDVDHFLVSDKISETKYAESSTQSVMFPLYLYPEDDDENGSLLAGDRSLNFDRKIYGKICKAAGLKMTDVSGKDSDFREAIGESRPAEVKVFDYIYGVLYSPEYRSTYGAFLKTGYPRVPYPFDSEVFIDISEKGEALRRLHLMEPDSVEDAACPFIGEGVDIVAGGYPKFEHGRVYINPDQYFDQVPLIAWDLNIGGYQPAHKWLKDRRGREITFDDIRVYQRIIGILVETDRIMGEIELPLP